MFSKSHWIAEALTAAVTILIVSLEHFITIMTHHPRYIFDHKEFLFVYRSTMGKKATR